MSKTGNNSKYQGFRQFYEEYDEGKPRVKKPKTTDAGRMKNKLQNKLKRIDPRSITEDDYDEFADFE